MMLGLPHATKIYFCNQPLDFRKSFDGLSDIVESVFEMNVLDRHLFLFVDRRGDRIKTLWWEPGGLILWYKQLEQSTFEMPRATEGQSHITIGNRHVNGAHLGAELGPTWVHVDREGLSGERAPSQGSR